MSCTRLHGAPQHCGGAATISSLLTCATATLALVVLAIASCTPPSLAATPRSPLPPSSNPPSPLADPLLFIDLAYVESMSASLALSVAQPTVDPALAVVPDKPWESWAVFGYNHVMQINATHAFLYYDCIEASATGTIGGRRVCLAVSTDQGETFVKPNLHLYSYNGSTANNIVTGGPSDSAGVSVFADPSAAPAQRFKMIVGSYVYAGADGLNFTQLYGPCIHHADDTKNTAYFDTRLGKYVIFVRRDLQVPGKSAGVVRWIGRCVTDDLSNWEKEAPDGCPTVFGPDSVDPDLVDVYTNSLSILHDNTYVFFPSFYHHFGHNPFGFGNDGLLDIRLVISRNASSGPLSYVPGAANARSPVVPLTLNLCGPYKAQPSSPSGWCAPSGSDLAATTAGTSATYMASGHLVSADKRSLYFYASAQPMTHGGDAASKTWGANTGIRRVTYEADRLAAVVFPYAFGSPQNQSLVTKPLTVPPATSCPPPQTNTTLHTSCAFEQPTGECAGAFHPVPCTSNADCVLAPCTAGGKDRCTCHDKPVVCAADRFCAASDGDRGSRLCVANTTTTTGGVTAMINVRTSVVGFVQAEVVGGGDAYALAAAVPVKGNTLSAALEWTGVGSSLNVFAGKEIQLRLAGADANLYSLFFSCG